MIAGVENSMPTQQGTCQNESWRCGQVLSMQAQSKGRAELATQLLSSLTKYEWSMSLSKCSPDQADGQ